MSQNPHWFGQATEVEALASNGFSGTIWPQLGRRNNGFYYIVESCVFDMGVPKFYRWISERYPCLSEVVREYQIPDFDNLYLDMNGIIHGCSHPNDDDPHFRITEEKIFADICHYIESLFKMLRPKKVFFMAVDGVAPRAKMNQQRGRRFRSAREAEECEKRAVTKGEILPTEERFDSNCITPGTEFMVKLHEHLKYFVTYKISTDKSWRGIRVYLSGHETPGEGEHKIMDFIRYEKSKPDYNPHTRHCLYGLDADLIMLGLCSHEPHFSLLREEINFARKKNTKVQTVEETTFHLLHLSLLREYIDYEFSALKDKLPFPYDVESIIDDWVLIGFLVGNDFIPNLPNMHIAHDALPALYRAYIQALPTLDGYVNEGGYLNLPRFEKYLERVALSDYEQFQDVSADLKWFKSKTGRRRIGRAERPANKKPRNNWEDGAEAEVQDLTDEMLDEDLICLGEEKGEADEAETSHSDPDEKMDTEDGDLLEQEFAQHKRDYYINKLEYEDVTPEVLREQAECYVRAIQWILHYYYNGVCSWSWYYPHHYAPFVSDVKDFRNMHLDFDMAVPFLPFEQLLAVLPAASKQFLPKPYQRLMCDPESPLIEFYPTDFKSDLNGKQHHWEAIVLIPFIDEKILLDAMKPIFETVSQPERERSVHRPCLLYTHSEENLGKYSAANLVGKPPDVEVNHAKCERLSIDSFHVLPSKLTKGLCRNHRRNVYIAGFPTLKHIPHKASLRKAGVRVFTMPSRSENMILEVENSQTSFPNEELMRIGREILGRVVYVGWPHLTEAMVVSVSTPQIRVRSADMKDASGQSDAVSDALTSDESQDWHLKNNVVTDRYNDRWGIKIGKTQVLVEARKFVGKKYVHVQGDVVTLEKQWSVSTNMYAYQTVVKYLEIFYTDDDVPKSLGDLYPVKSTVFLLASQYYGRKAEVVGVDTSRPKASVELLVDMSEEPNLMVAISAHEEMNFNYITTYTVAQRLGVSVYLVSRMMGTFQIVRDGAKGDRKVNIGLNLKFNMRSKEVVGYSKRVGKDWLFSPEASQVMQRYMEKFPDMFDNITLHWNTKTNLSEEDIFPDDSKLDEVLEFLKATPCYTGEQQACGAEVLDADVVKAIEDIVDKTKEARVKTTKLDVRPRLIFSPADSCTVSLPDFTVSFELFDRVINVREGGTVPLGLKGTVIGIHPAEKPADVTYDVVFDDKFPGGLSIRCAPNRGYRISPPSVVNITHGLRKENSDVGQGGRKPTAIVRPQTSQHPSAGVYGKPGRTAIANKGPKFLYARGRPCSSGPAPAPNVVPRLGTAGGPAIINPLALHPTMGPTPPNLAQDYHFRKFNHSPNSPFVPRQTCPTATGQPQFITPKVFTNTQFQMQFRQPPPLISVRQSAQPQESKFENFWMHLRMANTNTPTVRNREDAQPPDKPQNMMVSKTTPRPRNTPRVVAMLGNPGGPCHSTPRPSGPRQSQGPVPTSSEFEKVLQALQNLAVQPASKGVVEEGQQPRQVASNAAVTVHAATAELKPAAASPAIENVLRKNESGKDGASTLHAAQTVYGRSISVEELFRDAKETERQRQTQSRVPLGPKLPVDNASCVSVLEHFVYSYSRELPNYDCILMGPNNWHVGQVILPDKRAFIGRPAATIKAAEDSAAAIALNALGQQVPKTFPSNMRGQSLYPSNLLAATVAPPGPPSYQRFPAAPMALQGIRFPSPHTNRAGIRMYTPHRQQVQQVPHMPIQYENISQYGPRPMDFHKQYQDAVGSHRYGPHGRVHQQNQPTEPGPQMPNSFVPLQVSRQQKSAVSKKTTYSKEQNSTGGNDMKQELEKPTPSQKMAETFPDAAQKSPTTCRPMSGDQGKIKRRSSRLAVNFSNIQ